MRNKNKFASHSINMNFEVELEKKLFRSRPASIKWDEMKSSFAASSSSSLFLFFFFVCFAIAVSVGACRWSWPCCNLTWSRSNDEKSNCCCWITHFSYGALGWVDGWSPHIAVRAKELETYFMLNIIFKKSLFYKIQFIIRLRQVTRLAFINQLNSLVFLTIFKSQTTTSSLFKKSSLWLLVWWSRLETRVSLWMQELIWWFFIIISPSVKTLVSQRKIYT